MTTPIPANRACFLSPCASSSFTGTRPSVLVCTPSIAKPFFRPTRAVITNPEGKPAQAKATKPKQVPQEAIEAPALKSPPPDSVSPPVTEPLVPPAALNPPSPDIGTPPVAKIPTTSPIVPSQEISGLAFTQPESEAPDERPKGSTNFGSHRMRVFSGSSNPALAEAIAKYVGKSRSSAIFRKSFSDGETYVRVDESVRGCNVFLVQPTSAPTNDHIIELLLMIDACRRASAHQVTAVIPYYGYSRADRLIDPNGRRREALTSKLVANMLSKAGTDRVVLVDIHSPQTCGFFDIPVDHVYASQVLEDYLNAKNLDDFVVVAPDAGGVGRARAFAKGVNDAPLAFIDKRRDGHNVAKVLHLIGDVKGKTAVLVDDMIDTAGTITEAAKMLRKCGARQVFALATHAIFSGPAVERLSSGVFEEVIVTDTICLPEDKKFKQLRILSVAHLLGEQIWRVHEQSSR